MNSFAKLAHDLPAAFSDPEKRARLSKIADDRYRISKQTREDLRSRWDQVDSYYFGPPEKSLEAPWAAAPIYEFMQLQEKLDALRAHIGKPILAADPMVIVRGGGELGRAKRLDRIEAVLMHALRVSEYKLWIPQLINIIGRRGQGHVRPVFVPGAVDVDPRVRIDLFEPGKVTGFPDTVWNVDDLLMHGIEYPMLRWEFEHHVESGAFFEGCKMPSGGYVTPTNDDRNSKGTDSSVANNERIVPMHHFIARFADEGLEPTELYEIHFCDETSEIVRAKRFDGAHPYHRLAVHIEPNTFYNRTSRGYALVAPARFSSDVRHMVVWLSYGAAGSPKFVSGLSLPDSSVKLSPFHAYKMSMGGRVESFDTRVDMAAFPQLLGIASTDLDSAARISANGTGVRLRGNATAAEVYQANSGQEVGLNDDMQTFCEMLCPVIRYLARDVLYPNWAEWSDAYHTVLPTGFKKEELLEPFQIEINGQSPMSNPLAVMEQATRFMQMLGPAGQQVIGQFVQQNPDMVLELFRSAIASSNLENRESIVPSPEELESNDGAGIGGSGIDVAAALSGLGGVPEGAGAEGAGDMGLGAAFADQV